MRSFGMTPIGSPVAVADLGAYWCAYVEPDADTVRRLQMLADMAAGAIAQVQPASRGTASGQELQA